jgi:hypothetical protein
VTSKQVALPVRTERLESKLYFANERTFLLHQVVGSFVRSFIERTTGNGKRLSFATLTRPTWYSDKLRACAYPAGDPPGLFRAALLTIACPETIFMYRSVSGRN